MSIIFGYRLHARNGLTVLNRTSFSYRDCVRNGLHTSFCYSLWNLNRISELLVSQLSHSDLVFFWHIDNLRDLNGVLFGDFGPYRNRVNDVDSSFACMRYQHGVLDRLGL